MGSWFSKRKDKEQKKQPTPTPVQNAQLKLRITRDRTDKFMGRTRGEIDALTKKAKDALATGKKEQATYFLKLRRIKTGQLEKAAAQIINLEQMVATIESEAQNQAFVLAISQGNAALQSMQEQLPIERVQQIMEDSADAAAYQQEIDAIFAASVGEAAAAPGGSSEADLIAELESMTAAADAAAAGTSPAMPAAQKAPPTSVPAAPPAPPDLLSQLPDVPTALPPSAAASTKHVRVESSGDAVLLPA